MKLSSDILEEQFGTTKVDVLHQDETIRIIATKTQSGQVLELSLVQFNSDGAKQFPAIHQQIVDGQSMGKAFRDSETDFRREVKGVGKQVLPAIFNQAFGAPGPATVVNVSIVVGPQRTPYAEIYESYSPVIEWPEAGGPITPETLQAFKKLAAYLEGSSSFGSRM